VLFYNLFHIEILKNRMPLAYRSKQIRLIAPKDVNKEMESLICLVSVISTKNSNLFYKRRKRFNIFGRTNFKRIVSTVELKNTTNICFKTKDRLVSLSRRVATCDGICILIRSNLRSRVAICGATRNKFTTCLLKL